MENKKNRIEYLDGHRGIAILIVALYHAFVRWPTYVPYGDKFSEILLFKYGWLGVELFFLLSGFVILMTLEKCASPREFLYRRWLRLFPAMLVCSLFVFSTAIYFPERPGGVPPWENLVPGLSFIEPYWWNRLLGRPIGSIEGAYWSLYVEFKFYVFAAVIYYWRGRNALIGALAFVFLLSTTVGLARENPGLPNFNLVHTIAHYLSFRYFGWFAAGAAFYVFSQTRSNKWLAIALTSVIVCAVAEGGADQSRLVAALGVSLLFAASVTVPAVQVILGNRFVQFFGAISYPFYLIHEGMMIVMIIKLKQTFSGLPMFLLPLPAIAVISLFAFIIGKYCEPAVRFVLMMAMPRKRIMANDGLGLDKAV